LGAAKELPTRLGAEKAYQWPGYRYYENARYQQRPDGAWLVVSPEYCAAPAEPVAVAPPPPPRYHDELGDRLMEFRAACEPSIVEIL
jgi:hypothetical protein